MNILQRVINNSHPMVKNYIKELEEKVSLLESKQKKSKKRHRLNFFLVITGHYLIISKNDIIIYFHGRLNPKDIISLGFFMYYFILKK
ncbi:MAG: hypothetical protein K0S95_735 [Pantoea eucrina]|jgi:hypothetical protein|nr:hypothetical protein [Pantoea eucrina]